ncbi:MAG: TIGR03936 family radical SAM-associated protein [Phycisphaerae bacterium]|jgi:radical SAM-linked protein
MTDRPLERQVPDAPAERFRAAGEYAVAGDLRYLSHHDELRLLVRALVRARWPLRYSQGFNPLPRLVLPLPRSVGMASTCQWLLVELREPRPARELADRLAATLPRGITLRQLIAPAPAGTPHPVGVTYTVTLPAREARDISRRLEDVLALNEILVHRETDARRAPAPLDIRPYLETLTLDGPVLRIQLRCDGQRTARPSEILTALGLAGDAHNHAVCRCEVRWDMELVGPDGPPITPEGIQLGRAEEIPNG